MSIYIKYDNADKYEHSDDWFEYTPTSLKFKILDAIDKQPRWFCVEKLNNEIEKAEVKKKVDKFVIVLTKKDCESKWFKLIA